MSSFSHGPVRGLDARGLPPGYRLRPDWEVTPREVKESLDRGDDVILVDCRTPEERQEASIRPSVFFPLRQDIPEFEDVADEGVGDNKDRPLVVYCHHGVRSLTMTSVLRAQGFTNVRSMAGGIDLWSIDIDPAVPRY